MGFRGQFIQGISWSFGLKFVSKGLTLIKIFVLARLLSQDDFGLFSLTVVAVSLMEVFTQTGINTILVQATESIEKYINTAWVISIIRGVIISMCMVLLAWPLQYFYNRPDLLYLIILAAIVPLVRGFINPAVVKYHKELEFSKDTLFKSIFVVIEVMVAIVLGIWWRNVYALILPMIVSAIAEVILTHVLIDQKPKLQYQKDIARKIFSNTSWLNSISILDYLNKNVDDLIIGKLLGTSALGVYRNSYAVTHSATAELGVSLIYTTFPIFSKVQEDLHRLKKAFLTTTVGFALFLLLPVMILLLFPAFIIQVTLGKAWLEALVVLPALAVAGYLQGLINTSSALLTVTRSYTALMRILAFSLITMVVLLIVLIPPFGFWGAGVSIVLSRLMTMPLLWWSVRKVLHE